LRAQCDRQRVERLRSMAQSNRAEEVVARVDVPTRPGQRWWAVSLEALSAHLWCNYDSGGSTMKVRLLEWLGGTMTPPTAKQTRILGESSGRSGEAPVHFKMVSPRSGVR
jgi:hypothetical protein